MNVDRNAVHRRIDQVRRVLFEDWDPLQVGGDRALSDEYDAYLGNVIKALDTGNAERIVDTLARAEHELGLSPVGGHAALLSVAHRLLELPHA
jgi:hypothetical protein